MTRSAAAGRGRAAAATGEGRRPTGTGGPDRMRQAVADYVTMAHEAYVRQARTLDPASQAAMSLLDGVPLHVAAVGTRHLHVIATREPLGGGQRGETVSMEGAAGPLRWTLSFYDPVVVPALGLVDERAGPAFAEVRRLLGIHSHVYHLTLDPRSGLNPHHAGHTGTGLANAHASAAREQAAIERAVGPDREPLARELGGALVAGLPRAAAFVARALAAGDAEVERLAEAAASGATVDGAALRKAVLAAVRRDAGPAGEGGAVVRRPAGPAS